MAGIPLVFIGVSRAYCALWIATRYKLRVQYAETVHQEENDPMDANDWVGILHYESIFVSILGPIIVFQHRYIPVLKHYYRSQNRHKN